MIKLNLPNWAVIRLLLLINHARQTWPDAATWQDLGYRIREQYDAQRGRWVNDADNME